MADILPVLIVGAGPAGLVSALSLTQNGIRVRIIDKDDKFHVGNRGFGIQPRTFELFELLGINDEVQQLSIPPPMMRAYKFPGGTEPLRTWDMYEKQEGRPDLPFPNGACLSQQILEKLLRNHLAKLGVSVELNLGLVAIDQCPDSVTATVSTYVNGQPTDQRETIVAKYLVGADGARGPTRKLLGLSFQGETRDADGMVWADVEILGLSKDYWHTWGTPGQFTIIARPCSTEGMEFGVGILGQNFDPKDLTDPVKLKEFFITETGRTDLEFGKLNWITYFRPNMRMVDKFQEGRAFVAGDAAHVHPPTGGQGMNCSVQDAFNLAWKLALALKGLASPYLLASYNAERLPVITQMLHTTSALHSDTASGLKKAPAAKIDVKAAQDDSKSGWLRWRNMSLYLLAVNYRFSDVVLEERDTRPPDIEDMVLHAYSGYGGDETLCAGDRAPDAPGLSMSNGTTTSLLKIFKTNVHTVLIFGSDLNGAEGVAEITNGGLMDLVQIFVVSDSALADSIGGVNALIDAQGHAKEAYRVDASSPLTIFVVRPDGYLGAVVREVGGVGRYFSKILSI